MVSYQTLSDEFCKEFNLKSKISNSIFNCGDSNRCIYINKDKLDIIHIGCFSGTQKEAIKAISKNYKGDERDDYINKVNECFNGFKISED